MNTKINKILLGIIYLVITTSLSADWVDNYFGRHIKEVEVQNKQDAVGFYVGFRYLLNETTIRRNANSTYIVDGGYEIPFGISAPIRERLIMEVGGSIGNLRVVNSDNDNIKEDLFTFTIEASAQQLNYFGSVNDPMALAFGLGIGMRGTLDYQLENQYEEQIGLLELIMTPSVGLHYSIFELNAVYRIGTITENYGFVELKLIY